MNSLIGGEGVNSPRVDVGGLGNPEGRISPHSRQLANEILESLTQHVAMYNGGSSASLEEGKIQQLKNVRLMIVIICCDCMC